MIYLRCLHLPLLLLLFFATSVAAQSPRMTVTMPEPVVAETISAILPLNYPVRSKGLQGVLHLIDISNLRLGDDQLSCRIHLAAKQLRVSTKLAGHSINFKVGEVEVDFQATATIRFDSAQQILYVKPVVDKIHTSRDGGGGDVGVAIMGLVDDRELPIRLNRLDPFTTRIGDKNLTLSSQVADIHSSPHLLRIELVPHITSSTR